MFRRLMQAYLGLSGTVDGLIDDAELEWRADRQVRFTLGNVLDAIAPTNFPLTNPAVLKETIDRRGANLLRGGRRLVRDVSKGRLPAMVDTSKFEVGGNLALTPGSIVLRTEVFELIKYAPQTAEVYETPLLIVPPTPSLSYGHLAGASMGAARRGNQDPSRASLSAPAARAPYIAASSLSHLRFSLHGGWKLPSALA
jgi:polyhydroxyalkanoate synthase